MKTGSMTPVTGYTDGDQNMGERTVGGLKGRAVQLPVFA
jgi:hypothetical protein